jgi:glutamyl-tRNA synthetase
VKPRARTLRDVVTLSEPFWRETIERDPAAVAKHLSPDVRPVLARWRARLESTEPFTAAPLEAALRALAAEQGIKAGTLIHATRVAVTGQAVSPSLFDVLEVMGRDRVLRRLADIDGP